MIEKKIMKGIEFCAKITTPLDWWSIFWSKPRDIELQSIFPAEYDATSSHKDRNKHDMQFAFSYNNYVLDGNGSETWVTTNFT